MSSNVLGFFRMNTSSACSASSSRTQPRPDTVPGSPEECGVRGTKRKRKEEVPERPLWALNQFSKSCVCGRLLKVELKLEQMKTSFNSFFQAQEENIERLDSRLSQIEEEAKRAEDLCESTVVSAIDSLQKRYLSVKESIEARREAAAAPLRERRQSLLRKLDNIIEKEYELLCQEQAKSSAHLLQDWSSLLQLCEEDLQQGRSEGPVDVPLSFELTKQAFVDLGVKLQDFCDKEFALVFQAANSEGLRPSAGSTAPTNPNPEHEATTSQPSVRNPSGVEEFGQMRPGSSLSVVPRTPTELPPLTATREQYLKFACHISLDPHTAHPDLYVFPEEKKVELRTQKSRPKVVRCPQRFALRRQVLCRQPLPAEPCYFEVKAQGGKSEIALTYVSINRKSGTVSSAFGATNKSWSLDCATHYSVSHNGESIQLTSLPTCPTIGVFVDFKTGTLRYYEVTETMKFLYQVPAKFTEPLYPGFWLEEKSCITICDLIHSSKRVKNNSRRKQEELAGDSAEVCAL